MVHLVEQTCRILEMTCCRSLTPYNSQTNHLRLALAWEEGGGGANYRAVRLSCVGPKKWEGWRERARKSIASSFCTNFGRPPTTGFLPSYLALRQRRKACPHPSLEGRARGGDHERDEMGAVDRNGVLHQKDEPLPISISM